MMPLLRRAVNVLRGRTWVLRLHDYRHALILYVLQRTGPMGRRRLVKLLFLIDRELCNRYGASAFRWVLYKYGPLSWDVYNTLDDLEELGLVEKEVAEDDIVYRAAAGGEPRREVEEAADAVIEKWGGRRFDELVSHVNGLVEKAWRRRRNLLC